MNSISWWMLLGGTFLSGILMSVSPCPLTTNIAAISFIGRHASNPGKLVFSGFLYALGRAAAYILLSFGILYFSIGTQETLVRMLGITIHKWVGPMMILVGMMLCGLLEFPAIPSFFGKNSNSEERRKKIVSRLGIWSAFPLGIGFALAFCPTSAAAFFAMLGMAAEAQSLFIFPLIFSLASALPVIGFAFILAFLPGILAGSFRILTHLDWGLRLLSGSIFILAGIYFSLIYVW